MTVSSGREDERFRSAEGCCTRQRRKESQLLVHGLHVGLGFRATMVVVIVVGFFFTRVHSWLWRREHDVSSMCIDAEKTDNNDDCRMFPAAPAFVRQ